MSTYPIFSPSQHFEKTYLLKNSPRIRLAELKTSKLNTENQQLIKLCRDIVDAFFKNV